MFDFSVHFFILFFYVILIQILAVIIKPVKSKGIILFGFTALYLINVFFAWTIFLNSPYALENTGQISYEADKVTYIDPTLKLLNNKFTLIPKLPNFIADIGFNILIYWVAYFYKFFFSINRIDYMALNYFHIFLHILFLMVILSYINKFNFSHKKSVQIIALLLLFFDPLILSFSSVLLREMEVAFLLFIAVGFYVNRQFFAFFVSALLLITFRYEYLLILPIFVVADLMRRIFFRRYFIAYIILIFLFFSFGVHILSSISPSAKYAFFHHAPNAMLGSGIGSKIASLPITFRTLGYSILGFFSPIPFYPIIDHPYNGIYIFYLINGISGIFYLAFHLIIVSAIRKLKFFLKNHEVQAKFDNIVEIKYRRSIYEVITQIYLLIIIAHLVFQGLIFNVRHKVQYLPLMIYLVLLSLQYYKLSFNSIFQFIRMKKFIYSVALISTLNLIYFYLKVF